MIAVADKKQRLNELDALRGIGALAVVVFHYTTRFHEKFPDAPHVPFNFIGGNYRVLLFFAISGFAIFFTLDKVKTVPDFVLNRVSRLYPAYWMAMLLTLGFEYLGGVTVLQVAPGAVLANISMLEGFVFMPAVDGAYWTLTVEIGFYASMLLLWIGPGTRRLEPVLLLWLAGKWLLYLWPAMMPERIVMLLVLRYIPFFAIGMLSYRVWAGKRSWRRQSPYLLVVLLTIAATEAHDLLLMGLFLVACFWAMVQGHLAFLCVRPLLWFGSISYSFYLVHQNIGFVVMLRAAAAGLNPWIGFLLAIAVAIGLGTMVNHYVEQPAARAIMGWWNRRRQKIPTPAPAL
jgi:peptidoglycan/LPS O-acetylase OafA/YrhL